MNGYFYLNRFVVHNLFFFKLLKTFIEIDLNNHCSMFTIFLVFNNTSFCYKNKEIKTKFHSNESSYPNLN